MLNELNWMNYIGKISEISHWNNSRDTECQINRCIIDFLFRGLIAHLGNIIDRLNAHNLDPKCGWIFIQF